MFKVKGQKNFIFQGFLIVFKVLRNFFALKCSLKLFIWMRTVNTRRLIPHLYTSSVTCDVTYGKNDILRYFAYSLSRRCWVWGPYEPKIHPRTAKLNWFSVTVFLTSAISRILRIHEMKKLLDLDRFELVNTLQPHRKVVENSFWCQNKGYNISGCWLVFGHTPTQCSRSKVKKTSFFKAFW